MPPMSKFPCAIAVALTASLWSSEALAELTPDCAALGGALVEHSCFHSKFGPFASVQASEGGRATEHAPDVDAVHTEFRVGLGRASEAHVVTYKPQRSGTWIVFTSSDVPLTVLSDAAGPLPVLFEQNGDTGCDALPRARVYDLSDDTRYNLQIGPVEVESLSFVSANRSSIARRGASMARAQLPDATPRG